MYRDAAMPPPKVPVVQRQEVKESDVVKEQKITPFDVEGAIDAEGQVVSMYVVSPLVISAWLPSSFVV